MDFTIFLLASKEFRLRAHWTLGAWEPFSILGDGMGDEGGHGGAMSQATAWFALLASHSGVLVSVPHALLLSQLPAKVPGKTIDDGSNIWTTGIHVGSHGSLPAVSVCQGEWGSCNTCLPGQACFTGTFCWRQRMSHQSNTAALLKQNSPVTLQSKRNLI